MEDTTTELQRLLEAQSIQKGDFVLVSGARSHYYCDTKATALSPRGARLIGERLYDVLADTGAEAVGGLAMGAAYLASVVSLVSAERDRALPGFVVRNTAKDHGTKQQIDTSWIADGPLIREGRKVAVVDDVVTSAGSIIKAIDVVEAAGCEVVAVAAVLDRQAGGGDLLRERGYLYTPLYLADDQGDLSPA